MAGKGMADYDWLTVFRYVFSYGGYMAGFKKISGIGARVETESLYEGGRLCAYPLAGAKNSAGRLTLEKGYAGPAPLTYTPIGGKGETKTVRRYGGANPFLHPDGFHAGDRISKPCSIILLGEDRRVRRVFAFDRGVLVSWECSALDAGSGELLIDRLEIAHTGIYELDVPVSGA